MFHSLPNPRGGRRVQEAWRVGGPGAGASEVVTERRGDSWSRPGKAAPSPSIRLTRHSVFCLRSKSAEVTQPCPTAAQPSGSAICCGGAVATLDQLKEEPRSSAFLTWAA